MISCPEPVRVIAPRVTWPTIRHLSVGVVSLANRILTLRDGTQVWSGLSTFQSRRGTAWSSAAASSRRSALTGTSIIEDWAGTAILSVARGGASCGTCWQPASIMNVGITTLRIPDTPARVVATWSASPCGAQCSDFNVRGPRLTLDTAEQRAFGLRCR